ncbi:MAG: nucleoside triphosphate pyrophosphatase [Candidatus Melainabacteria bacterium]
MKPPLILASQSPRRRELLASLGIPYEAVSPGVDEEGFDWEGVSAVDKVQRLSREKAMAVAARRPEAVVIGSDTIVVLEGVIYEKPVDAADACRMLGLLQGRTHEVLSAVTVIPPATTGQPPVTDYLATQVTFRTMTPEEIRAYVATGEPMDKAGAYAIQGWGSLNIERIDGCYFNVVGMSLILLSRLLTRVGYPLNADLPVAP